MSLPLNTELDTMDSLSHAFVLISLMSTPVLLLLVYMYEYIMNDVNYSCFAHYMFRTVFFNLA